MPEIFHAAASFGQQEKKPLRFEADVFDCEIEGEIPDSLQGAYFRAGPDRQYPSLENDIVLNGDGQVSAFWFEDGRVRFRSRYVMTERLRREREAHRRLYGAYRNKYSDDPSVSNAPARDNTGNTYAFAHHGDLYALREDSRPHRIDPATLETLPIGDFGRLQSTAVTAHPKIDPVTGEWWSYGVFARGEPTTDASLHVFDRDGKLVREEWFQTPFPGLSHDWGVTREHIVFPIMPLTADDARLRRGGDYYEYDPDLSSAWGIMPRNGSTDDIRWFRIPNLVMGHVMNAFTEGNVVHVDTPFSPGNCFSFFQDKNGRSPTPAEGVTQISRISFDLSKPAEEAVTITPVEGALGDMPRIDDRFAMDKYRIGYFALRDFPNMGIGQLDWESGDLVFHALEGAAAQEPVFVPRSPDAPEGDGYVLAAVDRFAERRTDLLVLDGNDVSRPPIATVKLPFALPMAFHGCWMEGVKAGD
ncbi:carotenoid cleavage dioxygenase [Altererythrobacter atlanticus]|uniref:Dioxygenase n=1 Tax=Croceibacterium atlanticum TaxID=1267766 RepID=A0A0F7KW41_9SPHN|nr:carotenoid oxygenase family protein [Croceibacterium atlanticum]AKH43929.1 Lignostilbene-alpha,beta-dioxygenase isozyme I [Croceibacterium atlanticum]MBB5733621.1 carotenoid cleavage dioxygenase [Croceibacterium atlanticum]